MGLMDHEHPHRPHRERRSVQRRALWIALAANGVLLVGEVVAGVVVHSLALIADAVHLLTDVSGLAIALLALRLMERPATPRRTFGLERAEVLAAQANAVILLAASGWVFYAAAKRLAHPVEVRGGGLLVVATVGLVVNVGSAWMLSGAKGRSLNMRGAFVHLASDALGSVAAMTAGVLVLGWGLNRADPAMSIVIGVLVVWAAWRLLADATQVLLEGAPVGMDVERIHEAMSTEAGVRDVHHVHVWNLASDVPALSAHVVLTGNPSMHDAQLQGEHLKSMLSERFGVEHVTLELECHGHVEGTGPETQN